MMFHGALRVPYPDFIVAQYLGLVVVLYLVLPVLPVVSFVVTVVTSASFFFKTFSLPCVYKLIISWKIGKLKIIGIRASWLSWTIVLWTRCWYQYIFRGGTLNTEMMLFRITNLTFFIAL